MADNDNSNEVQATLLEIFELIVNGIMERLYEDENVDENLIRLVTSLLSLNFDFEESIILNSVLPSGEAPSLAESEPAAQIPETAPIGYPVQENSEDSSVVEESIVPACGYAQSSGDQRQDGETVYDDVVMPAAAEKVLCASIEQPAKELTVMDGDLIGIEHVSPRKKSTWKRVKRVFRVLFCCGCKTAQTYHN